MKMSFSNKKRVWTIVGLVSACLVFAWLFLSTPSFRQFQDSPSDHCTVPYPGKPLVQYAVMIDAGSSGSRVHVYKFNHCKQEPELENEVFHMLRPGLSSFADDPSLAADSLDSLLQIALESVPDSMQACTPIAVKATAGLRLLGTEKSTLILEAVRDKLAHYPFHVADVSIMDGKEEGVYAWITVNYLLGKLKPTEQSAATFDLGGASTQIVFEPDSMVPGEHVYQLDYAHQQYDLYQHSYLGFGLNEARKRIKQAMADLWTSDSSVYHPCLPDNYTEMIHTSGNDTRQVQLIGTNAGHAACRAVIEQIFEKEKTCPLTPCAFDGVYQPPLKEAFLGRDLYVFSYFYDLTQPLGMPSQFTVRELGELSERVCRGDLELFRHIPNAPRVIRKDPNYCLDLTYTHALLRIGYDISPERIVHTAQKIQDAETGWCLGASIAMMNDNQLCY